MDKIIAIICFLVAIGFVATASFDGAVAVLLVAILSTAAILLIRQLPVESEFVIRIFLIALIVRMIFGLFIHYFELRDFLGGDYRLYDLLGNVLSDHWHGRQVVNDLWLRRATDTSAPGWGMNYLVGIIYFLSGRNILAAQSFCGFIGAATAPMVYLCAYKIFQNQRVGKISAILAALFPAFIIWSSQLLKDGLIIFLLVLSITLVLQLQQRINYFEIVILIISLFGILSLRFYIFYMVAIAVAGSFIIGLGSSAKSLVRSLMIIIFLGLALTYLGVIRNAGENFDKYASLERIQSSRSDLATAGSGFGEDIDVSTTEGAISAIPLGLTYLLLAPFPWDVANFRQSIVLPEMLVWWASMPLLFSGLWYTLKNRLREAIPVLIFTVMLTIAYSIFQGNVGTAYRQRTQIQVFLFIFIAVGWTLWQEQKENRIIKRMAKKRQIEERLKNNFIVREEKE